MVATRRRIASISVFSNKDVPVAGLAISRGLLGGADKARKVPGWIGWTRIVPCVCSSSAELQLRNAGSRWPLSSPAVPAARLAVMDTGESTTARLMVHSMLFHSHCRGAGGCGIRTIRVRINSSSHIPLPLISLEYMIASERKVLWLMGSFSIFVWPWAIKMNLLRIS
ncbi:uncharacterized protein [Lolium perenne]|uniref:uncharacterized protein isoform X2 n=1 Tax=Lolium perenne TaxID=4522 RepID=UPI0021F56FFC|nr:uncharacterized protein LOC127292814 [Lolium perenne]